MKDLDRKRIDRIIRFALKEDIWTGDITSQAVVDRFLNVDAVIMSHEKGVVCGMEIVERVLATVEYSLRFRPMVKDGDYIEPGQEIAFIEGEAQAILKAERTALNFLGMLSGVATKTREMVDKTIGTKAKVYDTRKTVPLLRYLQKYAVTIGGGCNHRKGLWDMVLIKDNHIRALAIQMKTSDSEIIIKEAIRRTRRNAQKNVRIEIEVETLKECEYALEEKPDVIMLDNMSPHMVRDAVALRKNKNMEGKVLFEVSGGVSEENIKDYAGTGIEIISIGAITDFVRPIDFSLEIVLKNGKI
jgi:nicotinate-nucleotide pyrophosphorylase (carboxylating)